MKARAMLTDLEAAAVGEIQKYQPCTGHFVRNCFRESLAKHFSDSAGSVYPMLKRLEARGILESTRRKDGRRFVQYLSVTRSGQAAMREWLGPPVAERALITIDPLRTRMLYLNMISPSRRIIWLDRVESSLQEKLTLVKQQLADLDLPTPDAVFAELAIENGISELQSRLKWITKARRRLESEGML